MSRSANDVCQIIFVTALCITVSLAIVIPTCIAGYKNIRKPHQQPELTTLQTTIKACVDKGGIPVTGFVKEEGYTPKEILKDCKERPAANASQ